MENLAFAEIGELHDKLKNKEMSSVELTKYFLDRIKKYNGELNAYLTLNEEEALKQAEEADAVIASGEDFGPLTGIPFGAKDLFSTKGLRTTASSKILDQFVPVYDATVIQKLKAEK